MQEKGGKLFKHFVGEHRNVLSICYIFIFKDDARVFGLYLLVGCSRERTG